MNTDGLPYHHNSELHVGYLILFLCQTKQTTLTGTHTKRVFLGILG